jgi:hypothetical protein
MYFCLSFIGVIETFASDFCNCVDYPAALIALFSARNQANPPPGFLVTGKAKRGCPGSVQDERDVSLRAVGATVFNDCVAGFQRQFAGVDFRYFLGKARCRSYV